MVIRIKTISGGNVIFGNVGSINSNSAETTASGSGGGVTGDGAATYNGTSSTKMTKT
ncbi:spore germination protein GerPA/GerPF [Tumebacillus sp. BK434]|uniref:hypothetical protein n=1 Tax=Tumebacillus sp. BK434 TaxID=2512169 RepID=UPI0010531730|nr:hypothetical protein [Tumebacillus sp. BK434]TCP57594.1 spore germination protein GerPA/GerPF [Tumebacillus sp. BK434]